MSQDTHYPDPAQLRKYAEKPMPFHNITPGNLEILTGEPNIKEGTIRWGAGNVEYRWSPESLFLETEDERIPAENMMGGVYTAFAAFREAMDLQIEEDFIVAVGIPSTEGYDHYEATWVLSSVTIDA